MVADLIAPTLDAPPLRRYGLPELVKGESPAAGANYTVELTGGYFYRLVSLSVRLTPDGNAANRTLYVEYRDAEDTRIAIAGAAVTVPASDTTDFFGSAFLGTATWEVNSTVLFPLEPLLLYPTWDFRIAVDSIQVGDTLTRIRYIWERYFTGDQPA